ncbi:adenylate/guanylate cyclase domain-containing protein [Ideonella sp. BN130291]|uniref:adenylate/guanylate cyclase domain-containing protein n=1 Tax=Ideonella sp. BN130291 TaxID=3112940 RepID=UPI002E262EDB|nr:adenylate/guanylate cyclase domain-containing protein [Ideonella sp. BN130291]
MEKIACARRNASHRMGMKTSRNIVTMSTTTQEDAGWPQLRRARRAIVVVDVVESVRLMQQHEDDVIDRWRRFVNEVRTEVLPVHGGRLVKSLGDGMLLEFAEARRAVQAGCRMQQLVAPYNEGRAPDAQMQLRIAVHVADVVVDELDVYGAGVNLTARLAGLARPGDIVVSAEVRDELLAGLDVEVEDLGECYLKHIEGPQRAFRVRPVGGDAPVRLSPDSVLPLVAVLPLRSADGVPSVHPACAPLADAVSAALSRQSFLCVVSRLSVQALAGRNIGPRELRVLNADYTVQGSVGVAGSGFALRVSLVEVRSGETLWSGGAEVDADTLFRPHQQWASALAESICSALLQRQLVLAHQAAMPSLPGYALLLQAVGLLHRLSRADSQRAGEALEHLVDRHPRAPEARAWLAKWHFLRVAQNWTTDRSELDFAERHLERALADDEEHGLALAMRGHLYAFKDARLEKAEGLLRQAVALHPNEALAWAFLGNTLTYLGRGEEALDAVRKAQALSPLDPMNYFVELLASCAYSLAGRHREALVAAERSVALNALHLSSMVQLMVAAVEAGDVLLARRTAQRYLAMRPAASVQRFLDHHVAGDSDIARRQGAALLEAGIPR